MSTPPLSSECNTLLWSGVGGEAFARARFQLLTLAAQLPSRRDDAAACLVAADGCGVPCDFASASHGAGSPLRPSACLAYRPTTSAAWGRSGVLLHSLHVRAVEQRAKKYLTSPLAPAAACAWRRAAAARFACCCCSLPCRFHACHSLKYTPLLRTQHEVTVRVYVCCQLHIFACCCLLTFWSEGDDVASTMQGVNVRHLELLLSAWRCPVPCLLLSLPLAPPLPQRPHTQAALPPRPPPCVAAVAPPPALPGQRPAMLRPRCTLRWPPAAAPSGAPHCSLPAPGRALANGCRCPAVFNEDWGAQRAQQFAGGMDSRRRGLCDTWPAAGRPLLHRPPTNALHRPAPPPHLAAHDPEVHALGVCSIPPHVEAIHCV